MNSKSTILLVVIAAALGGWLYFKGDEMGGTRERQERARKLMVVDIDAVDRLALTHGDLDIEIEKRGDGQWWIVKPLVCRADATQIAAMLAELDFASRRSTLSRAGFTDPEAALEQIGLARPQQTITLWQGQKMIRLDLGLRTALPGTLYARVVQNRKDDLVVIEDNVLARLADDLFLWRAKTVFDFQSPKVESIVLRQDQRVSEAVKVDGVWEIERPFTSPANGQAVISYLSGLLTLQVEKFVSDDAGLGAGYGLTSPTEVLQITFENGDELSLRVGSQVPDASGSHYAQIADQPIVFVLSAASLQAISGLAEKTRENRIVFFNTVNEVKSLNLAGRQIDIFLQRDTVPGTWRFKGTDMRAESNRVNDFLEALRLTRAIEFLTNNEENIARSGLAEPFLSVSYSMERPAEDGAENNTVSLGRSADGQVYARVPSIPFLLKLDSAVTELAPDLELDWYSLRLLAGRRHEIDSITWNWQDRSWSIERNANGFWPERSGGELIDAATLDKQLDILSGLNLLGWFQAKEGEFNHPSVTLEIRYRDGSTHSLTFVEDDNGLTARGRLDDQNEAFVVTADSYVLIRQPPVQLEIPQGDVPQDESVE